MKQKKEKKC